MFFIMSIYLIERGNSDKSLFPSQNLENKKINWYDNISTYISLINV